MTQDGRVTFLEAEQSLLGASADRTSKVYRWEVRMTPAELAQAISRYGSVGTVRDVVPRRFGVSGRVIELAVSGSDGELVLRGLRVRWGLGLRENLFVVDRERDAVGRGAAVHLHRQGLGPRRRACARWARSAWPRRARPTTTSSSTTTPGSRSSKPY